MDKPPRKHHFVQAEHIRQFTNDRGTVFVFSKDGRQFESSPEALYKQRDLNSFETQEGIDTRFEGLITDVENKCWPAINRTIMSEDIGTSDIPQIITYIALSRMRNPSVQKGIIELHRQTVETTANIMDRHGQFDFLGPNPIHPEKTVSELLSEGDLKIEINNSVYLSAFSKIMESFSTLLLNAFRWNLVKSKRGRVIISDHPLTYLHPGEDPAPYGITPGGKSCEIAFPLSKRLYLIGLWERHLGDLESENSVDELNKRQAIFANRHIASPIRRKQWKSLASRYKHFGLQTVTNALPTGDGAYHITRNGVYQLPGTPNFRDQHPLTRTVAIEKISS